jgi:hypothetical protein
VDLDATEHREVDSEQLPSIQRLKTMAPVGRSRRSDAYHFGKWPGPLLDWLAGQVRWATARYSLSLYFFYLIIFPFHLFCIC